ncbi:hypothetical protein GRX03_00550 [Halovenus sp. WSH3]|uniref:Uncharacterized protein n=1 Tax=Halovenus carboxidivorans TaxID=2692199 RepID=A0A6B0TA86_9EURY|nr:hypothetical protein [Halovenus carboxidivorans]
MSRRPVEDDSGTRYLLLKRSSESSLVRNVETGEREHVPNDRLTGLEDASALDAILAPVPEEVRTLLSAVHDDRALAVLLELDTEGPMGVRQLLSAYEFCESDLHGLLAELQAAGLIEETTVAGERGYTATETAADALARLTE